MVVSVKGHCTYDRRKPVDQRITKAAATEPMQKPEKSVSIVIVVTVDIYIYIATYPI